MVTRNISHSHPESGQAEGRHVHPSTDMDVQRHSFTPAQIDKHPHAESQKYTPTLLPCLTHINIPPFTLNCIHTLPFTWTHFQVSVDFCPHPSQPPYHRPGGKTWSVLPTGLPMHLTGPGRHFQLTGVNVSLIVLYSSYQGKKPSRVLCVHYTQPFLSRCCRYRCPPSEWAVAMPLLLALFFPPLHPHPLTSLSR